MSNPAFERESNHVNDNPSPISDYRPNSRSPHKITRNDSEK